MLKCWFLSAKRHRAFKNRKKTYLPNNNNKHPFLPQLSRPLQPRGSRAGATARTRPKAARAPPRADPTPLPEPCVAAQSLPGPGRCQPPHPVHPSRLPASPPAREAPGAPRLPPRPAQPGPGGGAQRARARGAGPVPLPNVRAPHAQCAPAVSVCLNRKADILVPHGPPRPTPLHPSIRRATRPFPSRGRSASQKLPPAAAAGTRLSSILAARSPARPFRTSTGHRPRPAPPDTAAAAPAASGQNGRVRLSRGGPAPGRGGSGRRAGPSGAGDAGLDRL